MIAIAMGPVIMTAGLGYYNYKDLLQKEERGQLESRLDGSIQSIEAMVDSLKSVVLFVARPDRYMNSQPATALNSFLSDLNASTHFSPISA